MALPPVLACSRRLTAAVALVLGVVAPAKAGTFTWTGPNTAPISAPFNVWSAAANWGGVAPTGTDITDILNFNGDGTSLYSATNDFANAFVLNQLVTNVTSATGSITLNASGTGSITLSGTNPQILQNGAGLLTIDMPVRLGTNVTFGGSGTGTVTINGPVSGNFDITKVGTSVFRFGSASDVLPSDNTWIGNLNLQGGTFRFNNNVVSGRTALRSNQINITTGATLSAGSELRVGAINGTGGTVSNVITDANTSTQSIVISAIQDGVYGGFLNIGAPTGTGGYSGNLIIRSGSQTFNSSTSSAIVTRRGDIQIGYGAKLTIAGNVSLAGETSGGVVLNGGTFVLDNSTTNSSNRLRDFAQSPSGGAQNLSDSTILDAIGGGTFQLIGSTAGTAETSGRLQLGSVNNSGLVSKARSGAVNIVITHRAASAATTFQFAAYTRDGTSISQYTTIDFSAQNGAGATLDLGLAGNNPRVFIDDAADGTFTMPTLSSGLIPNTNTGSTDAGWATVNGSDFATYTANGVAKVSTTTFPTGSSSGSSATNYALTGNGSTTGSFQASSLKLAPTAAGQALTLASVGTFTTRGIVLGGTQDYTIGGSGTVGGAATRYFHVKSANLTIDAPIGGTGAIVKSGAGTLTLTNTANASNTSNVIINQGQLRASLGSLPTGETRFRGGVLEVTGGGTYSRNVGFGTNTVNWAGADINGGIDEDRGSGGFAAINGDLTVDLGGASQTGFAWEQTSFVNSGHALVFGSAAATSKVNWVDNLNLTSAAGTVNYNTREIRVIDNPAVNTDRLQMSGAITGTIRNDLLKTGSGVLELSGANSYGGATFVKEGTLLVNGTNAATILTTVMSGAKLGGIGSMKTVRIEGGGTLNPGEITGVTQAANLTINGDLTFTGSTANFQLEIGTGVADKATVNGAVTLNGSQLSGSLLGGFIPQANDLFFVIINDGTDAVQGTFAQGATVTIGGVPFDISYNGDSVGGTFAGGNDVVLRAVPEPSTVLLLGSAIGFLAARRRRRA